MHGSKPTNIEDVPFLGGAAQKKRKVRGPFLGRAEIAVPP